MEQRRCNTTNRISVHNATKNQRWQELYWLFFSSFYLHNLLFYYFICIYKYFSYLINKFKLRKPLLITRLRMFNEIWWFRKEKFPKNIWTKFSFVVIIHKLFLFRLIHNLFSDIQLIHCQADDVNRFNRFLETSLVW